MDNKITKKSGICIIVIVCIAGLLLSSCGKEEAKKTESVIVLGSHSNSKPIDIKTNKLIDKALDNVCRTGGKLSVIVADGSPFLAASYELKAPEKGVSENVINKHVSRDKATLKDAIKSSKPYAKKEETDPVNALKLAGRIFESAEGSTQKELLFVHSGLATSGVLKDNLTANPEDLIKYLDENKISFKFDDVNATLTHMGEVAGKQKSPTDAQLLNIENIYTEILKNGGATVKIDRSVEGETGELQEDLPHVSVVKFPGQEVANLAKGENAILEDSTLTFYPNKAILIDETSAKKIISPYAEQIKSEDLNIVVLGLTAKVGERESSIDLSKKRAQMIATLFENEGVNPSSITTVGGGFDTSFYIPDTDKNGKLIIDAATKNRRVILLNSETESAKQIVKKHG